MDATADLRLLLASRHPLIVAEMDDEQRFMAFARRAAQLLGLPLWTWSVTRGLARDGMGPQADTLEPNKALAFIGALPDPGVFVLHDLGPALGDPVVLRRLKEFALASLPGQTVVITGPSADVPPELEGEALPWRLEPPTHEEMESLVRRVVDAVTQRGLAVAVGPSEVAELVEAVQGLSMPEAERLIMRSALAHGKLDASDAEEIRVAKGELLADDGVLSLIATEDETLDAVGGLDALKGWLRVRGKGFEPAAKDYGLEPPRGVLLLGVPGCGKSLVAKTLARTWRMPLVLLDPGAIYGSFVGQSEERLHSALHTVEAMAPVVLWIDEVEKGFASGAGAGDSGVSQRVLGAFLRWMQERAEGVFVVATCNEVDGLPSEFLRRGRFDETFFVDLPGPQEREAIATLHLRRRKRDPASFDLARIAAATDGFSGAEIEGAIVAALYRAYARGGDLTTDDVVAEAEATVPLARARAEDIARTRSWAEGRSVSASGAPASS